MVDFYQPFRCLPLFLIIHSADLLFPTQIALWTLIIACIWLQVNAHVKALKTLCKRKAMNPQEADALVTKSADQIFCKASRVVDMYLSEEQKTSKENNLFTPPKSTRKGKREATPSKLLLQATTAVYTIGSLVIICPSLDIKAIVPVLHSMITSGTHEPRSNQLPGSTISVKEKAPCLYIQAWLTMGKICLADGKLAKRYIPLFVQVC